MAAPLILRPLGEVLPDVPARFPDLPPETWERLVETPAPRLRVYCFGALIEGYDSAAVHAAAERVLSAACADPRLMRPRGWASDRRVRSALLRRDRRADRRAVRR